MTKIQSNPNEFPFWRPFFFFCFRSSKNLFIWFLNYCGRILTSKKRVFFRMKIMSKPKKDRFWSKTRHVQIKKNRDKKSRMWTLWQHIRDWCPWNKKSMNESRKGSISSFTNQNINSFIKVKKTTDLVLPEEQLVMAGPWKDQWSAQGLFQGVPGVPGVLGYPLDPQFQAVRDLHARLWVLPLLEFRGYLHRPTRGKRRVMVHKIGWRRLLAFCMLHWHYGRK